MTIVVFSNGEMACDSLMVDVVAPGEPRLYGQKIFSNKYLHIGLSGDVPSRMIIDSAMAKLADVIAEFENGVNIDQVKFRKAVGEACSDFENTNIFILSRKTVLYIDILDPLVALDIMPSKDREVRQPRVHLRDHINPMASGTGNTAAYAALSCGYDVKGAVQVAIASDRLCGGPITHVRMSDLEPMPAIATAKEVK